jgi:NADH:ubiquinone oxidoreductase subunit F (NADH-binding)
LDPQKSGKRLIERLTGECDKKGFLDVAAIERISRSMSVPASRPYAVAGQLEYFDFDPTPANSVNVCCGPACELAGSERLYGNVSVKSGGGRGARVHCFTGSPFWHLPLMLEVKSRGDTRYSHMVSAGRAPSIQSLLSGKAIRGAHSLATSIDERISFISSGGKHLSTPERRGKHRVGGKELVRGNGRSLAAWLSHLDAEALRRDIRGVRMLETVSGSELAPLLEYVRSGPPERRVIVCDVGGAEPENSTGPVVAAANPIGLVQGLMAAAVAAEASEILVFVPHEDGEMRGVFSELLGSMEKSLTGFGFGLNLLSAPNLIPCDREIGIASFFRELTLSEAVCLAAESREGLWNARALVSEPEVFTGLASLASQGPAPFKSARGGGTRVISVGGAVSRPRIIEAPLGMTVAELLDDFVGGIRKGGELKAVHFGGVYGGPLKPGARRSSLKTLYERNPGITSGQLLAIDESTCMVQWAEYFAALAERMCCGACSPGRLGPHYVARLLGGIRDGGGEPDDFDEISATLELVRETALCPQAARVLTGVSTGISNFRKEFEEHVTEKKCRAHVCWP